MLSVETRAGLEEEPLSRRLSALVSKSPMVKGIGPVEEFCMIAWSAMLDMRGGELVAARTVKRNVVLDESEPSLTLTVIVEVPD